MVSASSTACLTDDQVIEYASGKSGATAAGLGDHLLECDLCLRLVTEAVRSARPGGSPPGRLSTLVDGELLANRYTIRRLIARGGMGEVYEAHDTFLDAVIALKTIAVNAAEDPRALHRLKDEVLLARRVSHPHVCRIMDFGVHQLGGRGGSVPFLTMELLSGETLGARLHREGPLPIQAARAIALEILAGLQAIHGSGIVHRDFKTDNVFLACERQAGERAVLIDFGLAKGLEPTNARPSLTVGTVVGTVEYMAPEQLEGAAPTVRFDVYAFGVVLFEMVTGQRPFVGGTAFAEAARRFAEDPRRASALRPELERGWDQIIFRCLERQPSRRFASADDIRDALLAVQTGSGRAVSRSTRRVRVAGLAAVVLLGVAVAMIAQRSSGVDVAPAAAPATGATTNAFARSFDGPRLGRIEDGVSLRMTATPLLTGVSPNTALPRQGRSSQRLRVAPPSGDQAHRDRTLASPANAAVEVRPATADKAEPSAGDAIAAAEALLAEGLLKDACEAAETIKQQHPEQPEIYRLLAKCYMRQAQPSLAKAYYRRYLQRAPNAPDAAVVRMILE